jgi:hypothetical protein
MLGNLRFTEPSGGFHTGFAAINHINPTGVQGASPGLIQSRIFALPKIDFGY